jgi:hypothetical protein
MATAAKTIGTTNFLTLHIRKTVAYSEGLFPASSS